MPGVIPPKNPVLLLGGCCSCLAGQPASWYEYILQILFVDVSLSPLIMPLMCDLMVDPSKSGPSGQPHRFFIGHFAFALFKPLPSCPGCQPNRCPQSLRFGSPESSVPHWGVTDDLLSGPVSHCPVMCGRLDAALLPQAGPDENYRDGPQGPFQTSQHKHIMLRTSKFFVFFVFLFVFILRGVTPSSAQG